MLNLLHDILWGKGYYHGPQPTVSDVIMDQVAEHEYISHRLKNSSIRGI